jgi:hypothetical protein
MRQASEARTSPYKACPTLAETDDLDMVTASLLSPAASGDRSRSELTPEGNVRQPHRQQERDNLKQLAPQMDLFG